MIRKILTVVLTVMALMWLGVTLYARITSIRFEPWVSAQNLRFAVLRLNDGFAYLTYVSPSNPAAQPTTNERDYWILNWYVSSHMDCTDPARHFGHARWSAFKTMWFVEVGVSLWLPFVLLSAYPLVTLIRGPYRRYRRRKKGLCLTCGYDLKGNVSGVCSECGQTIT